MAEPENTRDIPVTPSSGNVFAELDSPIPRKSSSKPIWYARLSERWSKPAESGADGRILGISQPAVSNLVHGHYEKFFDRCLLRP